MATGCGNAKDTLTPLHMVKVNLKNTIFAEEQFQHAGNDEFLAFTDIVFFAGQKKIFC